MDKQDQDLITEQYARLPDDIKAAIKSVDSPEKLGAITKRQSLHIDQAASLENETLFVLLGLEHPSDYIQNIQNELRVPKEKAEAIAEDVNESIFNPIKESLKRIHDEEDNEEEIGDTPTSTNVAEKTIEFPSAKIPDPVVPAKPSENPVPPSPQIDLSKQLEIEGTVAPITPSAPVANTNIIENKLTEVSKRPVQEIEMTLPSNAPKTEEKPIAKVDPYREPVE